MQASTPLLVKAPNAIELQVVNGFEIFTKQLPPLKWIVKPILHEGATLLSGDPKVGKSFLALQIAVAVAGSADKVCGSLSIETHGNVLYLALDDGSERRIQDRLRSLGADEELVKNIDFVYQRNLPPLSQGFDQILDEELTKKTRVLVVLDTLGSVLNSKSSNSQVYRTEYQEAITLQKLAQKHGTCLLIVHHTNKGQSKDPVAKASGSHGLTGAVDSVLMLSSENGRGRLQARPRDWEESEHKLERGTGGGWQVANDQDGSRWKLGPVQAERTDEELAVLGVLKNGSLTHKQIANELSISPEAARKRVSRMEKRGLVRKTPEGTYELVVDDLSTASAVSGMSNLSTCPENPINDLEVLEQVEDVFGNAA
jgi:hypothetical protein